MINFNYETEFTLDNEQAFSDWLSAVIVSENKNEGEINYCVIFGQLDRLSGDLLYHWL